VKTQQQYLDDLKTFEGKLGFDPSEVSQSSDEWHMMRLGVISASKADCLLAGTKTAKYNTYLNELIAEICTGRYNETTAASMQWGKDNELAALSAFEFHSGLEVYALPFIYKDESMRVGCSPDGMTEQGGIEAKCPKTSKVHIDFLFDGVMKSEYVKQVQFQMWVTGTDSWTFLSYDPRMKKNLLHSKLIERDEKTMKLLDEAAAEFTKKMDDKLKSQGFAFGEQWEAIE
jgi:predicted phage-related endonuclease